MMEGDLETSDVDSDDEDVEYTGLTVRTKRMQLQHDRRSLWRHRKNNSTAVLQHR